MASTGPDAIALAAVAGLRLDEWQQTVVTEGLAERADGRWAASECCLMVPRQNGKGGVIEALALTWLFLLQDKVIIWSAHEYRTAANGFKRIKALIRQTPTLDKRVEAVREVNGEQQILTKSGSVLQFNTRSRSALRGFTGDKLILDEAQELTEPQMAAIMPTGSARSLEVPGPQFWYFLTPPDNPTAWCYCLRQSIIDGDDDFAGWDWGLDALPGPDGLYPAEILDSEDAVVQTNPAYGIRISRAATVRERKRLKQSFARERLGIWLPRVESEGGVISASQWEAQELPEEDRRRPPAVAFAARIATFRSHTAIGWAGRMEDGRLVVGLDSYRPGVAWAVPRLVELQGRHDPIGIALDTKGGARNFEEPLREAGIEPPVWDDAPARGDLWIPTGPDVAAAFGTLLDLVREQRLWHVGDAPLSAAVPVAATRVVSGGLTWDDRRSPVDISPLQAVTDALGCFLAWEALATEADYDVLDSVF